MKDKNGQRQLDFSQQVSLTEPMNWRPGIPLGDTADSYETYEIYDELCTPDGQVVATLACFVWNPTVYYCNALTPAGKRMHFRAGHRAYATTRDWAERVAGLKVDRDLSGRGGIAPRVARPQKQKNATRAGIFYRANIQKRGQIVAQCERFRCRSKVFRALADAAPFQQLFCRPRLTVLRCIRTVAGLAHSLQTSPEWLISGIGPEEALVERQRVGQITRITQATSIRGPAVLGCPHPGAPPERIKLLTRNPADSSTQEVSGSALRPARRSLCGSNGSKLVIETSRTVRQSGRAFEYSHGKIFQLVSRFLFLRSGGARSDRFSEVPSLLRSHQRHARFH